MKKVMPPFLKQPPPLPILPNPQTLPFYGKNLTPPPPSLRREGMGSN